MTGLPADRRAPAWVVWHWSAALRGALLALPACLVLPQDADAGVAVALGVIPAAALPLVPRRRGRLLVVAIGSLMGVSVLIGGLIAVSPWLAVPALTACAFGASLLATRRPKARILLLLAVPLIGVGLSYPGPAAAAPLAVLFVAGSVYGWLVSLFWPETAPRRRVDPPPPNLAYGLWLALAAGVCAALGFALHLDHVGWPTAAALLVMRPGQAQLELRAIGRPVSVMVGALAAVALVSGHAPPWLLTVATAVALVAATATVGSRWYVMPAFTTFLVFLLLLGSDPSSAAGRFWERLGETVLGVAVAVVFGVVAPVLSERCTRRRRAVSRPGEDDRGHG
ncbi:FUSC family protein [Pseudonocardia yuanmonensis]|uniref:FUSC family protein n=1 Tax=Pseudonocardia yuanmonensis TaxID=1095914 RepID=UPI0031EC5880